MRRKKSGEKTLKISEHVGFGRSSMVMVKRLSGWISIRSPYRIGNLPRWKSIAPFWLRKQFRWSEKSDLTRPKPPRCSCLEGKWDPLFGKENLGWWNVIPFGQILGCPVTEVDGSMVRIDGLFNCLINGIYHIRLISPTDPITFDPNFLERLSRHGNSRVVWGTTHLDIQLL